MQVIYWIASREEIDAIATSVFQRWDPRMRPISMPAIPAAAPTRRLRAAPQRRQGRVPARNKNLMLHRENFLHIAERTPVTFGFTTANYD